MDSPTYPLSLPRGQLGSLTSELTRTQHLYVQMILRMRVCAVGRSVGQKASGTVLPMRCDCWQQR